MSFFSAFQLYVVVDSSLSLCSHFGKRERIEHTAPGTTETDTKKATKRHSSCYLCPYTFVSGCSKCGNIGDITVRIANRMSALFRNRNVVATKSLSLRRRSCRKNRSILAKVFVPAQRCRIMLIWITSFSGSPCLRPITQDRFDLDVS